MLGMSKPTLGHGYRSHLELYLNTTSTRIKWAYKAQAINAIHAGYWQDAL